MRETQEPTKSAMRDAGATEMRLRICVLGPFDIAWQGPDTPFPKERLHGRGAAPALGLLKALLSRPDRFATRDWLLEQFWPESAISSAQARLDDVASGLRALLRSPGSSAKILHYVYSATGRGSGYRLESYPGIWVDTDAFTWCIEQAARFERFGHDALPLWEQAHALGSRGSFLPEELYSDWAQARREELAGQYRQCVHRLGTLLRERGATEQAILRLRTSWQAHPTDEDLLRPLMEILGEQERYQEAEQYYQQFLQERGQEGKPHEPDFRTQEIHHYLKTKQLYRASQRTSFPSDASGGIQQAHSSTRERHTLEPLAHNGHAPKERAERDQPEVLSPLFMIQKSLMQVDVDKQPEQQRNQQSEEDAQGPMHASVSDELIPKDLEMVERLIKAVKKPARIDQIFIAHLEAACRNHRKRFVLSKNSILDIRSLYQDISTFLLTLTQMLEQALPSQTHSNLCTFVGETAQLLGDICFYEGWNTRAHLYYKMAMEAAREAQNETLQAVILGRKCFLPLYTNDAPAALPYVEHAHTLASPTASDSIRAWLLVVEAEIQAAIDQSDACFEALHQSEFLLHRSHSGLPTCSFPPETIYSPLNTQRLQGYMGACSLRLRQPQKAQSLLKAYFASIHSASLHKQSLTLIDLAKAALLQEELEEMGTYADQAIGLLEQTRSARVIQRLLTLRQELEPWSDTRYVKHIDQRLEALSPTALFQEKPAGLS